MEGQAVKSKFLKKMDGEKEASIFTMLGLCEMVLYELLPFATNSKRKDLKQHLTILNSIFMGLRM